MKRYIMMSISCDDVCRIFYGVRGDSGRDTFTTVRITHGSWIPFAQMKKQLYENFKAGRVECGECGECGDFSHPPILVNPC